VKDAILLSLPDLHERILKESTKSQKSKMGDVPSEEIGTDPDDIFS
jgi:hypothetical protein